MSIYYLFSNPYCELLGTLIIKWIHHQITYKLLWSLSVNMLSLLKVTPFVGRYLEKRHLNKFYLWENKMIGVIVVV